MKKYFSRDHILISLLALLLVFSMMACGVRDVVDPLGPDDSSAASESSSGAASSSGGDSNLPSLPNSDPYIALSREETSLLNKMLADEKTIESDIIAGIDHSSVVTDGEITYFSSVMSDGATVRFEAKNISIDSNGVTMFPGSEIVSLDSVGKIFAYSASTVPSRDDDTYLFMGYAYTFSSAKTSVLSADEVHKYTHFGSTLSYFNLGNNMSTVTFQPNFVYVEHLYDRFAETPQEEFQLTSLIISYDPTEKTTEMESAYLNADFFAGYLDGERYDAEMAEAAEELVDYRFYLCVKPKTGFSGMRVDDHILFVPADFYTVGDLKDKNGTVLDKKTAVIHEGTTLDILLGDNKLAVELTTVGQFVGADTLHDTAQFCYPSAIGEKNVLVIPIVWADQQYMANDETMQLLQKSLGRIFDKDGNVIDYSDPNDEEFSLSEYFDISSYGKMSVRTYITDYYYYTDRNFAEWQYNYVEISDVTEMIRWVKKTQDIDLSQFDQDENGYIDSVILINLGGGDLNFYVQASYGGAVHTIDGFVDEYSGTTSNPKAHSWVSINIRFLEDGPQTLIHEFGHNFGIKDYYDVTYSGINAVGRYDMQSQNVGDWNAYSKLAVGWMDPTVITNMAKGESVEITIGSSALTNDVIVIPAAGNDYAGPFSEYIMIDLLTDDGVNAFDAEKWGLGGVNGVRISHVNASMELHEYELTYPDYYDASAGNVGILHYSNNYATDGMGRYNLEVIQAGKVNTFTTPFSDRLELSKDDLFFAGDTFTVEEYDEFFYMGLMDNAQEFGYTVEIVSIGTDAAGAPSATVRITAN